MIFPCVKCKIHNYKNTQIHKYAKTKCLKDHTCAIFLKSMGFKDIKYDIPVCQIHYIYITFTLHLHYIHTTFTLHSHYIHTTFTLHSHYIHTTFTLHSHYIHTTFTLHLHIDGASSRSFERHFLLAPSGALVVIMVYYIYINPVFQFFQILQILKWKWKWKDPTCAIFFKSMGFKDIEYDIPVYQM